MSEQQLQAIQRIKKTHENLVVTIGITIGIILGIYFFSFAALIDSAPPFAIQFQMVTSVLLVLALIYVKRIALLFTRLLLGRDDHCRTILRVITVADLARDDQTLQQQIGQRLS